MALPDFLIAIPEPQSQVRARDLPAGAFFFGFPDDLPFTDCFRASEWEQQHAVTVGLERWVTGLLTRAVVEPALTPELVQRLGISRDVLARVYLETVGWIPRTEESVPAVPAPMSRKARPALDLAYLTTVPGKNMLGIMKQIGTRTRRLPSELWALPISEWIFTLRCMADPVPDDDLLRSIGLEPN